MVECMVKLLLGIWHQDEGGLVKYSSPNLSSKEANQLLDNVLFSANIYGNSTNKMDVAFTIPIMYLPVPYTHGRIFFKFRLMDINKITSDDPFDIDFSTSHNIQTIPISIFCSMPGLNETIDTSDIDKLVWEFLNSSLAENDFNLLYHQIVINSY